MKHLIRLAATGSLAVAVALTLSTGPAMASDRGGHSNDHPQNYTCTGGAIPSGHYDNLIVYGACTVPAGAVIHVEGSIIVRVGSMLDAQSAPSTITVEHNVSVASGSFLGLGCQPDYPHNTGHPCAVQPSGHSMITVKGDVSAKDANTVLLNGITVKGDVTLAGGGGSIPWSIKNNKISGNLTVHGQTTDWLGVLFNWVGKNVTLSNITVTDPGDPGRLVFVVRNTIGHNLSCMGLVPGVSGGFSPTEVNVVKHHAIGQCASLV